MNSENSIAIFKEYPDVVDIVQMREMLGNIGINLAYQLLKQKKIPAKKIGREYKILKSSIIAYVME